MGAKHTAVGRSRAIRTRRSRGLLSVARGNHQTSAVYDRLLRLSFLPCLV